MQDIISTLKNALLQAEAGLEVAVGRLVKDGTERGDFKPSEVLALASVREALAMPVTCLHQIQEPAEYPHLPSSVADVVDFMNGRLDVDFGDPAPAGGTRLYSADQMRAYVDADRAQRTANTHTAPLPLLVRDIARDLGITALEACRALKDLGNFSVNTAVTAEMAAKLRELFPAPQAAPAAVAVPDERAAFEKWASFVGYSIKRWQADANLYEDNGTEDAWIAWQARAALAATPAALEVPAEGDPASLLQLADLLESGRHLIHVERKEIADAIRAALAATPAAPVLVDDMKQELMALYNEIMKQGRGMHYWNYAAAVLDRYRSAPASTPAAAAPVVPKWIDDPHDIEQGQMLNPEWVKAQTPAAAPVGLPETEAAVREVMELIGQFGLLVMQEDSTASIKHTEVIKAKLSALLAGVSAPAAQATEAMERAVAFALIGITPETPLAEASVKPYLKQAKKLLEVAFNAAPQAQADARDTGTSQFLMEADQHLLHRFIETTEDDESYVLNKEDMKRLAELGVVSNHGFDRYSVTMFGYWAHEQFWHQNPSLPLKTNADRDREHRAAIAAAKGEV